ncbi:MAG: hypothetical protein ACI8ZX_003072 [Planctomycetota bacterium]|jgi:hypothetical protein
MIKKTTFFLVLLISTSIYSQQLNFDKYQYIIVPDKFDFVKTTNEYQTSSLTKFLLRKKGFKVFLGNEKLPQNLQDNRCLALQASVRDASSMFTVKTFIELKNCHGKVLYTSMVGKSKEKDYQQGYQEAIRNAFDSMTDFEYSYSPVSLVKVEEEQEVIVPIPEVRIAEITKELKTPGNLVVGAVDVLYAQTLKNGFQLINTKPEVVFIILNSNLKDVFVIKDKNGVFYKVGELWVSEYYENSQLIQKEFQVKF